MNHSNFTPTLTLPRQWGGNILKGQRIFPSLAGREGVNKLSPVQRAGRDVVKVLQRYLFTLITYNEKLYHILTTYRLLLPLSS
jgi:hypothetical protein